MFNTSIHETGGKIRLASIGMPVPSIVKAQQNKPRRRKSPQNPDKTHMIISGGEGLDISTPQEQIKDSALFPQAIQEPHSPGSLSPVSNLKAPVVDIVTELTGQSPRVDAPQILQGIYNPHQSSGNNHQETKINRQKSSQGTKRVKQQSFSVNESQVVMSMTNNQVNSIHGDFDIQLFRDSVVSKNTHSDYRSASRGRRTIHPLRNSIQPLVVHQPSHSQYVDESILYSSQEPIALGPNNQIVMTAPFNPMHPTNPHYLPQQRSLVTPKNHYVEHFVKPDTYIKFKPKPGPLIDLN